METNDIIKNIEDEQNIILRLEKRKESISNELLQRLGRISLYSELLKEKQANERKTKKNQGG